MLRGCSADALRVLSQNGVLVHLLSNPQKKECKLIRALKHASTSEIVMVDLAFGDDFFKQNRSWDDMEIGPSSAPKPRAEI